jgi:hypothetical protein
MKKKYLIIGVSILALVVMAVWAIPVFAEGASNPAQSGQNTQQLPKLRMLARLLLIQDEAKVNALIAKAKDASKITAEQATKIKEFWTNHHQQFAKRAVLSRLLRANDGAKVQAFLDRAVAAGKIQKEQAGKIMTLWNKLHNK